MSDRVRTPKGGGGDWLDWVELGSDETLVAVELVRWDPQKDLGNGPVKPAICNVVICSGPQEGLVKMDEEIIGKGLTNKLDKIEVGQLLMSKVGTKMRGSTEYAIFVEPTDEEYDAIEEFLDAMENGETEDEAEPEPEPEPEPAKTRTRTPAKTSTAKTPVGAGKGRRPFG
jgi:hypothetical protein